MAAKKAKRMVWRISDIVRAATRDDGEGDYVHRVADSSGNDVPRIMAHLNITIPRAVGLDVGAWNLMSDERRAAALVAIAKRLRVPQVPA